jgi:hypothetical protein
MEDKPKLMKKSFSISFGLSSVDLLSYPVFIPKPSTHRMHDIGSIVSHIRPKSSDDLLSYPVFMPKPSTHRMHDPG